MRRLALSASFGLALVAAGCSLQSGYVKADRATFDAIAPVYSGYVTADQTLDHDTRERRLRTLESWNDRVKAAEEK